MNLPEAFLDRIKQQLGDEYEAFLASYDEEKNYALRVNPLKADATQLPFDVQPVEWCSTGFYYAQEDTPGKTALHDAGMFYIQDASAMLPAEMLELSESGCKNIVCTQPFGCLPNHICGKGMMKPIKERHPDTNIVAIDYDAGASRVNQENRLKLMLSNAKR